jgi:hypothetical protein
VSAALVTAMEVPAGADAAAAADPGAADPGAADPGAADPGAAADPAAGAGAGPAPGTPEYAAARRFAALPAAVRHSWLAAHLPSLRAGRIPLARLP